MEPSASSHAPPSSVLAFSLGEAGYRIDAHMLSPGGPGFLENALAQSGAKTELSCSPATEERLRKGFYGLPTSMTPRTHSAAKNRLALDNNCQAPGYELLNLVRGHPISERNESSN
jgi:hypothetical protein